MLAACYGDAANSSFGMRSNWSLCMHSQVMASMQAYHAHGSGNKAGATANVDPEYSLLNGNVAKHVDLACFLPPWQC